MLRYIRQIANSFVAKKYYIFILIVLASAQLLHAQQHYTLGSGAGSSSGATYFPSEVPQPIYFVFNTNLCGTGAPTSGSIFVRWFADSAAGVPSSAPVSTYTRAVNIGVTDTIYFSPPTGEYGTKFYRCIVQPSGYYCSYYSDTSSYIQVTVTAPPKISSISPLVAGSGATVTSISTHCLRRTLFLLALNVRRLSPAPTLRFR